LSAPLLIKNQCIGVIIFSSFSRKKMFTELDLEILETIAHHTSIAIENAKLYAAEQENVRRMKILHETLQTKNEQLKNAMIIHKKLTHIALAEQGVKAICETLATLINRPVLLFDDFFELLAASERTGRKTGLQPMEDALFDELSLKLHEVSQRPQSCQYKSGDTFFTIKPILASHTLLGFIVIAHVEDNSEDDLIYMACDLAATVLALEMTKEDSMREMHLRMIGNMFNELLQGKWDETLLTRIKLLNGGKVDSSYVIAVLQLDEYGKDDPKRVLRDKRMLIRIIQTALHSPQMNALFVERNERYFILYSFPKNFSPEQAYLYVRKSIERIRQEMRKKRLFFTISGGVGRYVTSSASIQESYQDAKACVEYIQSQNSSSIDVMYHELGVNRLFFKNDPGELGRFVGDVIGPIQDYDRINQTELTETLRVYLVCNRSIQQTAAALNIHKNTLHYRLKKAEELLQIRQELPGNRWMQIQLALEVEDYLQKRSPK
ncbi:MAG: helix-turn-helix domain-containing protein, partial [Clostridia bacterium]